MLDTKINIINNSKLKSEDIDNLKSYLYSDVQSSYSCRQILRQIAFIQNGIKLVYPCDEELGNGCVISLKDDYAIIGLFDEDYIPLPASQCIIPYDILVPTLREWKKHCERREEAFFNNREDSFIGRIINGTIVERHDDYIVLEYQSRRIFLNKYNTFWELRYYSCKNYLSDQKKLLVKIVGKCDDNNEIYIGSTTAIYVDHDPRLEPNFKCGAIWQGIIIKSKQEKNRIKWHVDIFPGCWGTFYTMTNSRPTFRQGERVTVLIQDIVPVNKRDLFLWGGCYETKVKVIHDCDPSIIQKQHVEFYETD